VADVSTNLMPKLASDTSPEISSAEIGTTYPSSSYFLSTSRSLTVSLLT
jgi:hypothetical protein